MSEARQILESDPEWLRMDRDSWKKMAEMANQRADHWEKAYRDMKEICMSAIKDMEPES